MGVEFSVLTQNSEVIKYKKLDNKNKYIYKYIFGKDIYRYNYIVNKYLISIPKGTKFSENSLFLKELENRNSKFDNSISKRKEKGLYWYDLRGCSFYNVFIKPIIIWSDIVKIPSFSITDGEVQVDTSAYFLDLLNKNISLKYLLSIMNSTITYFYMSVSASNLGNGGFRWKKIFIEKIPIPIINYERQKPFIELVDKILEITEQEFYDPKNIPEEQKELEKKIDKLVYELYGLNEEEIEVVEGSLK